MLPDLHMCAVVCGPVRVHTATLARDRVRHPRFHRSCGLSQADRTVRHCLRINVKCGCVARPLICSSWEAETGRSPSYRPAWPMQ